MHEPGRFYVVCDGETAELLYERQDDVLDVRHTWTPPNLRGGQLAAVLTDAVFTYARTEGLRVRPSCSYTQAYVARHPHLRTHCV